MFRKLILLGLIVGGSTAIPTIYQRDPESVRTFLKSALEDTASEVAAPDRKFTNQLKTKVLLGRRVAIQAGPDGHFQGSFKLNGRKVEAMVDTGATYIAINRSLADRIALGLRDDDFKYQVNTANGRVAAAATTIDSIQIGRIHIENVEAVVLDDESLGEALIGMSFLRRLARYEVERNALVLEQ